MLSVPLFFLITQAIDKHNAVVTLCITYSKAISVVKTADRIYSLESLSNELNLKQKAVGLPRFT